MATVDNAPLSLRIRATSAAFTERWQKEREAEEKAYRKYDGNVQDPRYREAQRKIDQKYDHKRGKVEGNLGKDHRKYHDRREDANGSYRNW